MKRILALAGVILILAMYITTFVLGMMKNPATDGLFTASVIVTLTVPVLIYGYQIIYNYLKRRNTPPVPPTDDEKL